MAAGLMLETESTLTDRYQTTVPATVRKALHLGKRDKIHYSIDQDGKVILSRAETDEEDTVVANFLDFLARDMTKNPERMEALSPDLAERLESLVDGVDVDLNAPLSDEDE